MSEYDEEYQRRVAEERARRKAIVRPPIEGDDIIYMSLPEPPVSAVVPAPEPEPEPDDSVRQIPPIYTLKDPGGGNG